MDSCNKWLRRNAARSKPKHILIFLDGTWNDENGEKGDGLTTNIHKLFLSLAGELETSCLPHKKETQEHIGLYFRGVGNDETNNALSAFYQGAFGAGERRIRDHAYCELFKHYHLGDKVSIFGFSRGAACARLLAAKLYLQPFPEQLTVCFNEVENRSSGLKEAYFEYYSTTETSDFCPIEIEFLGVFDTVSAFGLPLDMFDAESETVNLFESCTVSPIVKKLVHCVAIDEDRYPFQVTLCNAAEHIDEVWFAGVHSDIGGGYGESHLAKITFTYMLDAFTLVAGDSVDFSEVAASYCLQTSNHDEAVLHQHNFAHIRQLLHSPRKISVLIDDNDSDLQPKLHYTVAQMMARDSIQIAYVLDEILISTKPYAPLNVNALQGKWQSVEGI